jgi:hypothetical protein
MVSNHRSFFKAVKPESVLEVNGEYDGHVNRNIRIALALLDLSQPHVRVINITNINEDTERVFWVVDGCHRIDEARARFSLPKTVDQEVIHFIK